MIFLKPGSHIAVKTQQTVHALIVRFHQKIGNMTVDECRHLFYLREVGLIDDVLHKTGRITLLKRSDEAVYGLRHHVRVGFGGVTELKDCHDAVGTRDLLKQFQLRLMLFVKRQEVCDVLLETEPQVESYQQDGGQQTGCQA